MQINLQKAEAALKSGYRASAEQYRRDDEIEVTTRHHRRVASALARITASFNRPISVLDAGCGTGRYFYCLQNVERLVGMDITPEMLLAAENPVRSESISARSIQLIRENIFFATFAPGSFDFIYSFGMFGHGCPVTVELCNKFFTWLAPGGQLYFDTVDFAGLPWADQIRKRVRKSLYPVLPKNWQEELDQREKNTPFFGLTKRELENILRESQFAHFKIDSYVCESPLWRGKHLECRAIVPAPVIPEPWFPPAAAIPSTR